MRKSGAYLIGLGLFFALWSGRISPQANPLPEEGQAQEQALRKRVEEHYSLMQMGRWTQAEEYVTEESREVFRKQQKNPFVGFQVESVQLDPKGQEATVIVRVLTLTPISTTPLAFPFTSRWRLVKGVWYAEITKSDPNALKTIFRAGSDQSSPPPAPPPEELKFKGHGYRLATIEPGQIKTARYPFTNVTDHVVTITDVITGCDCLKAKLEKKEYKPGESGELAISVDPAGFDPGYFEQRIRVRTNPGQLTTFLGMNGTVLPTPTQKVAGQEKRVKKP